MKKILFLCFSILFTNFLFAQGGSGQISGSTNVEVGIANNYTFTFNPSPPTPAQGQPPTATFQIDFWNIIAGVSGSSITGNINNQINSTTYFYTQNSTQNYSVTNSTSITIPITFGDQSIANNHISFYCSGTFKDASGNFTGNFSIPSQTLDVHVNTIKSPTINSPSILDCCTNSVQLCATDYGDANQFNWTISGGIITSGQGTNCISVTPNLNGNVSATCTDKRSTGLANYTATASKIINRTARTVTLSNPVTQNYMCKGSGLIFQTDNQCGIQNTIWSAPNCSISSETIVNGKRQVTIIPNSSNPNGSSIPISVKVNFVGGCSAISPISSYFVYEGVNPPAPQGYFDIIPLSNDPCFDAGYNVVFVPTVPFVNGKITWSPMVIPPSHNSVLRSFTVQYLNYCTNTISSKSVNMRTPSFNPCGAKMAIQQTSKEIIIAPNPTNAIINVTLPEILSGTYQIFDQSNSILIQENKFDNVSQIQIELLQKLKSGIYILKVNTENSIFTEKIILNK